MAKNKALFYVKLLIPACLIVGLFFIIEKPTLTQANPASDVQIFSKGSPLFIIHTNQGDIKVTLDFEHTPISAQNFLNYAKEGFYSNTLFHRVIPGFMIQGGGFLPGMQEKRPNFPPIQNEANKGGKNKRGTLAMARTSDPNSATAQFFINVTDNAFLDFQSETQQGWGYCVFGQVVEGMDVVDKIKVVPTTSNGPYQDVPVTDVLITSVEIVEATP